MKHHTKQLNRLASRRKRFNERGHFAPNASGPLVSGYKEPGSMNPHKSTAERGKR